MDLHSLLGQHANSLGIEALVAEAAKKDCLTTIPKPSIKVYKDVVYYSYPSLGISFNFEPAQPLVPAAYKASTPDPSSLKLVAIHLYRSPADKFETFPLSFLVPKVAIADKDKEAKESMVEMNMENKGYEVVQLLGEPKEKQGGGRKGNCWIGYGSATGLSMDFAGSDWDDRDMALSCVTIGLP